jgi:hypothetical protein
MKKKCTKCNIIKELTEFHKHPTCKDGYLHTCKLCKSEYHKLYMTRNKTKTKEKQKEYRNKNKEKIYETQKKYEESNKDKVKERKYKYVINNKDKIKLSNSLRRDKINLYFRKRRLSDPLFRLSSNLRKRICKVFNGCSQRSEKTIEILGCSFEEIKIHIEKQFKEGMNWDNHGLYGWHIDHKIPLSSAKTEKELIQLCHYTNLQPLWAEENLKKNNKMPHELC